jgi:HD-like signal output (HDOD) protein
MQPSPPAPKRGKDERLTPQDVLAAAQRLPTTARVFAQINRLFDNPRTSLDEVTSLVCLDPVLSFRVLQLSNGAFYGFRTPCSDLNEAITRLGFREVNRMVGMVAAQQLCANFLSVYGISGERFWSDSLCCALACEWLAQHHSYGDARTAYTAGLLRSVGKVTLQRILVDRPLLWKSYLDCGEGRPLLEWETETFGLSSIEAGVLLMQSWQMPSVLQEGIRFHGAPTGDEPLPYLLHLAAVVAAQIREPMPGESSYWEHPEVALKVLEMDPEQLQTCASEVALVHERVKRSISA